MRYIDLSQNIIDNTTVKYEISSDLVSECYFQKNDFWIEYPIDITEINPSILIIPAVTNFLPVAWITGSKLRVDEIDETFFRSLETVKRGYERLFPSISFDGYCDPKKIIDATSESKQNKKNTAMIFSGGVDSIATYFRNSDLSPILIHVSKGTDGERAKYGRENVKRFANNNNTNAYFIKSNLKTVLNHQLLNALYKNDIGRKWWQGIQYGIAYMGICAPITHRIFCDTLYQSSGFTMDPNYPTAQPYIINPLSWSYTECKLDGSYITRQQKIRIIGSNIHTRQPYDVYSCTSTTHQGNCNECEKCHRNILAFLAENIDPELIGYSINHDTLDKIRDRFDKEALKMSPGKSHVYQEIQNSINNDTDDKVVWFENINIGVKEEESSKGKKKQILDLLPSPVDTLCANWYLNRKKLADR